MIDPISTRFPHIFHSSSQSADSVTVQSADAFLDMNYFRLSKPQNLILNFVNSLPVPCSWTARALDNTDTLKLKYGMLALQSNGTEI